MVVAVGQEMRPRGVFSSLFIGLVSGRFAVAHCSRVLLLVSLLIVTTGEQGGIDISDSPPSNKRVS